MIEKPNMSAFERLQNPLNSYRGSKYCFSERHMPFLFKKLIRTYGYKGNSSVNSTDKPHVIQAHILRTYTPNEVADAHEACVRDYQMHNPRASKSGNKPRMNFNNGQIEDDSSAMENALLEDDTPRDQNWLESVKTPEGPRVPAPTEDNFQSFDLSNYVTKPELVSVHNEIKLNFNAVGRTLEQIDKSLRAAHSDVEALNAKIDAFEQAKPTIVEIKRHDLPEVTSLGLQHRNFPLLLATVQSRLRNGNRVIPWVYGPAGTGKSFAAESLAKALNLKPYVMGTTLTKFEVTGFINTTGYQTTAFREAYEHGGAFCADEMDSWTKEATVALNNGLANSHFTFPDKTVARHPDFVMVACANTVGTGANLDYVGRNKLDGATLNRFAYIHWPLDEALEDGICANKDWLEYVRRVRRNVARSNLNPKPLITPRASIFGETLLNSGIEWATVVEMCLRQGLSDAQWNGIK